MSLRGALAGTLAATLILAGAAGATRAGPVLERVKASGTVHCAAEEKPGFAARGDNGGVAGLAVDLCRAIGVAVLGPDASVAFTILESAGDFDGLRDDRQDVAFLAAGTLTAEHLADRLLLGPPAFIETENLMVPEGSPTATPRDLAGRSVCFMIGTGAQRALEATLDRDGIEVMRLGFEEDVEMRDAYNVGRCQAVAAEATALAEMRRDGGVHGLRSRILPLPLAIDPVYLATGLADAGWAAVASATLRALVADAVPRSGWTDGASLAAAATPPGLRDGWPARVAATLGSYADLWRRHLGAGSSLKLAPGPNAPWPGGLLLPIGSP